METVNRMYKCSKINKITILYASTKPGTYAAEERDILGPESARAICEEANSEGISIEEFLKRRSAKRIESVVINTSIAEIKTVMKGGSEE
jgi:hypothetical protein